MALKGPTPPSGRSLKFWIFAVALFNGFALLVMMAFQTQPALREFQPSAILARASQNLGLEGIAQFVAPKPAPWTCWIDILQMADFFDDAHEPGRQARFHTFLLLPNPKAGYRNGKWFDALFGKMPKPLVAQALPEPADRDDSDLNGVGFDLPPQGPADAKGAGDPGDLSTVRALLYYLPTANRGQTLASLWRHLTEADAAPGADGSALSLVRESYDFDLAQRWLNRYCSAGSIDCATTGFSGPFLAVTTRPGGEGDETFLLIDLTPIREQAFPLVVAALREAAATTQGVPAEERIAAFKTSLAGTDIPSSDWFEFRSGDLAQTAQVISPKVQ